MEGEKWELEAINHPELGKRILTREVINKHLAKKHPVEYIFKRQYVKPDEEESITNGTLLKYNIVTPIQLKMFKELSAYKIYPIFKDNPTDFYKIEYEGEVYNIRSYRLRELRKGLKNSEDRFSTVERITAFIKGEEPKIKKPRVRRSGITYKPKEKKFECKCKKCNEIFKSGDVKTQYCDTCRSPQMCKCGCGQIVKTPGRSFAPGCGLRGRSYSEIYSDGRPRPGFKSGNLNIAKKESIRLKIGEGVKKSYTPELRNRRRMHILENGAGYNSATTCANSRGELFRSKWEVEFSELCISNNIQYEYEHVITLNDNSLKIVDFKINDVLLEISGLVTPKWQEQFIHKLNVLGESVSNTIIVLVDKKKIQLLTDRVDDPTRFRILDRTDFEIIKSIIT